MITQGRSERKGAVWVLAIAISGRWFVLALWWCWVVLIVDCLLNPFITLLPGYIITYQAKK